MSTTSNLLQALSNEVAGAVERSAAAVLAIGGPGQRSTTGTLLGSDLIVAIDHVLEDGEGLWARRDGDEPVPASVAGRDPSLDLALVRAPGIGGTPLPIATRPGRTGDIVVNVSRAREGHLAATMGVVGAVAGPVRVGRGMRLDRLLRADIAATRGISGSPLLNAAGEIIGIVNAGLGQGVPYALPIDLVMRTVRTLQEHGRIPRGYFGLGLQPVLLPPAQQAADRTRGLLVVGVEDDSPASRAGLLVGDLLLSADGVPLRHVSDLQRWLAAQHIGQTVALAVLRGRDLTAVDVTVAERRER
jgi:S1-C subfamily serine protease